MDRVERTVEGWREVIGINLDGSFYTIHAVLPAMRARKDGLIINVSSWAGIFHPQWMKMLTFATVIGLAYHVWVGMRDVLMDYVKPVGIRLVLQILVLVWLVGCAGWSIQVLWRV